MGRLRHLGLRLLDPWHVCGQGEGCRLSTREEREEGVGSDACFLGDQQARPWGK